MRRTLIAAGLLAMLAVSATQAQPPAAAPGKTVRCRDLFHQNADGSWSPNETITVGGATLVTAVALKAPAKIRGIDVVGICEKDGALVGDKDGSFIAPATN